MCCLNTWCLKIRSPAPPFLRSVLSFWEWVLSYHLEKRETERIIKSHIHCSSPPKILSCKTKLQTQNAWVGSRTNFTFLVRARPTVLDLPATCRGDGSGQRKQEKFTSLSCCLSPLHFTYVAQGSPLISVAMISNHPGDPPTHLT